MKLYNHTRFSDRVLRDMLEHASKAIGGVRTDDVVIKVSAGRSYSISGKVFRSNQVSNFWTEGARKFKSKNIPFDFIETDKAYMQLIIPYRKWDVAGFVKSVFKIMAHEWKHIKDAQEGARFDSHDIPYKKRIQEIRAFQAEQDAIKYYNEFNPEFDNVIHMFVREILKIVEKKIDARKKAEERMRKQMMERFQAKKKLEEQINELKQIRKELEETEGIYV